MHEPKAGTMSRPLLQLLSSPTSLLTNLKTHRNEEIQRDSSAKEKIIDAIEGANTCPSYFPASLIFYYLTTAR